MVKNDTLFKVALIGGGIYLLSRMGGFKLLGSVGDVAEGAGDIGRNTLSNFSNDLNRIGGGLQDIGRIAEVSTGIEPFSSMRSLKVGFPSVGTGLINVPAIIRTGLTTTPKESPNEQFYAPQVAPDVILSSQTGGAVASTTPQLQSLKAGSQMINKSIPDAFVIKNTAGQAVASTTPALQALDKPKSLLTRASSFVKGLF